jgi:opacity protein-like surface antigen
MQKLFFIAALTLVSAIAAQAQDPRTEIFGGYSYLLGDDDDDGIDLHGWNASFNQNLVKWAGIKADFSGHYTEVTLAPGLRGDLRAHLFLLGPQFTLRKGERVQPFVHALFGAMRADLYFFTPAAGRVTLRDAAFAMALGGGLDIKVVDNLAIRLFQTDYVLTKFNNGLFSSSIGDDTQHNFRVSTGLVLRFGEK